MQKVIAFSVTILVNLYSFSEMLNPRWWFKTHLNGHNQIKSFPNTKSAILFKLDMVIQNLFKRKWEALRNKWEDELIANGPVAPEKSTTPVPEFDWQKLSFKSFKTAYLSRQIPVVLKGFLQSSNQFKDWDFEDFIARYGDEDVFLSCPVEDGYPGKLGEVDIPGVYLHNSEMLLRKHPRLFVDMGFERICKTFGRYASYWGISQFFIGRKNTGSWWHCAGGYNIFMMLDGCKKWTFIDPAYTAYVFPQTSGKGTSTFYLSDTGAHSKVFKNGQDKLSQIDDAAKSAAMEDERFQKKLNLFAHCPRQEVVLEKGDVLCIPPWWWHDVENISDSSIAVASRWFDKKSEIPNRTFKTCSHLTPNFTNRMLYSLRTQDFVDSNGDLIHTDKGAAKCFDLQTEVLGDRTRGYGYDKYFNIQENVQQYYLRMKSKLT